MRREFRRFDIDNCEGGGECCTFGATLVGVAEGTRFEDVAFAKAVVDRLNAKRDFADDAALIASICASSSFNC